MADMSASDGETWLSTAQAAQALRLSQRQVTRYVEDGRLVSKKAGRRLLVSASSVASLADELAVDVPRGGPPARRAELPAEVVRYLTESGEAQRQAAEAQRQALDRLERIERRLEQPAALAVPPWLAIIGALVVVLLVAIVVLLALR